MEVRFLLLPIASLSVAAPSAATVFMTVEQAQQSMFPGASFKPEFRTLTDAQISAIEKASDTNVRSNQLRAWQVSTGGWFIADEVVGKHEFIPFALGLTSDGKVKDVEILEYREAYGGAIVNPKWRAQFTGKKTGDTLKDGEDIQNISGATLSSKHIIDGVRRLLTTYAFVLAH